MAEAGSAAGQSAALPADADSAVIVEDDALISGDLSDLCVEFGVRVLAIRRHAAGAIDAITRHRPDFVLMDVRLVGERDGVDVAKTLYAAGVKSLIIYITASTEPATLKRIEADHPHRVLIKPFLPADLRDAFQA